MMLTKQVIERDCIQCKLGVVMDVDRDKGDLTLAYGNGTFAHLTAGPSHLEGLRLGGPVQVMVEGSSVLTLRRL